MARFARPEELDNSYTTKQLVLDVWKFLKPYRGRFWLATLLIVSREAANLVPPLIFARIITLLSASDRLSNGREINQLLLILAASFAWQITCFYLYRLTSARVMEVLGLELESTTLRHLIRLNIGWHEKENSGNKIKRLNNGIGGIQQALRIWFNNIIGMIVGSVGIVLIMSQFNALTTLILVGYLLSYYGISRSMVKKSAEAANAVNIQGEKVSGLEFQMVSNIRTVKVMGMHETLQRRVDAEITEVLKRILHRVKVFQNRLSLLALWTQVVRLSTFVYITYEVVNGRYEVGFFILFNSYFNQIRELASNLSDIGQEIIISRFSVSRLKHMLSEPVTIEADTGKTNFPATWETVTLKDINFTYEKEQVLNNISLQIKRGEKIGIIGLSGAGKSTLFKLLLKEYENFSGSIQFDSTDIKQIKTSDYFEHVAVVLQDTEVFNFSVKENITLANDAEKDNPELLARALHVSHVEDFLHKLPEGVDSLIGEKGVKLSGGERQRLGIARAVFKQPQLLLLDEATSHLDVESEEKIKDSLHQFFEDVTAIVIAHRLTTVKAMDRIYVLEDGTIKESGTFDELYKAKGRFYELWEKQKL